MVARLHCKCQDMPLRWVGARLPPMPALFASLTAFTLLAQASPLMIPAKNGNTCPGDTSYAGAGYCKVRGDAQYFPARNGNTCPGGSSYAGAGYCKVRP